MHFKVLLSGMALGVAALVAGCATPGPGVYGNASIYHQQEAQRDWVEGRPNAAQWQQMQANKDRWISGF